MAGTAPTVIVVVSGEPKFVGRLLAIEPTPDPPPAEHPAASAATAVSATAVAACLHLPLPITGTPHLSSTQISTCAQGRINQHQFEGRIFPKNRTGRLAPDQAGFGLDHVDYLVRA